MTIVARMYRTNQQNKRGTNVFTKAKAKEEVKEKVREIRLRQQNWMKQREEQQEAANVSTLPTSSGLARNKDSESSSQNIITSKPSSNKLYSADGSAHPKGQLKNWLRARGAIFEEDKEKRKDIRHTKAAILLEEKRFAVLEKGVICNETVRHPDGGETNLLRLNSSRKAECATPDAGWTKDQVLGSSSSRSHQPNHPNSGSPACLGMETSLINEHMVPSLKISPELQYNPDQYVTLADDIISRVKQTLNLKNDSVYQPSQIAAYKSTTNDNSMGPCNSVCGTSPVSTSMSGHNCPICQQLMFGSNNDPMLVIPCGHTICDRCMKGRPLCPVCQSPVSSCMGNLMLKQIIEGFQQQRLIKKRQLCTTNPTSVVQSYQPLFDTEKDVDYTELYSNLKTRHEVLTQESSNLHNQFNECTQKVQKQRKQVENIEREEAKLTNEIAELTSRLHDLRGHRSEYEVKITEVGQKKEELARQLRLIEDTLVNVANQMEKIELLEDGC